MKKYKTLSCRVTGYRKLLDGNECEDAYRVAHTKNSVIAAVADGHGDRRCVFASRGAEIAVKVACDVLRDFERVGERSAAGEYWNSRRGQIAGSITQGFALGVLEDYAARVPNRLTDEETARLKEHIEDAYKSGGAASPDEIRLRYRRKKELNRRLEQILVLYGTTLRAVLVGKNYVFCLAVGDGDTVAVLDEGAEWLLPASEAFECETASMCMGLDEAPREFLFSFAEIKSAQRKKAAMDVAYEMRAVVLSTDGLRNSFCGGRSFCAMLEEITFAAETRETKSVRRKLRQTFRRLSRNSVFQDDITAVAVIL